MVAAAGQRRVTVPAQVVVQTLPDEDAVALNLATEAYYGFDAVGARFWSALVETGDLEVARGRLLEEFAVDPERLAADLERFVTDLEDRGLLVTEPA